MPYGHLREFSSATKPIIFAIKRTVLVPGVCPCIRIRSMMHYVHTGEVVEGEYRRQHAKHLFFISHGGGACQLDIRDRPSCGRELTCETIPISIDGP